MAMLNGIYYHDDGVTSSSTECQIKRIFRDENMQVNALLI